MSYTTHQVAVGIIRRGESLVLIQQRFSEREPLWMLPGGMVEPGELFTEALVREVLEETGLVIEEIGALAYTMQIDHPSESRQLLAFCFEVTAWSGTLQSADPDNEILDVAFVPLADALTHIEQIHWLAVREPLLAYLTGEAPAGTAWFYREENGVQVLKEQIRGERQ